MKRSIKIFGYALLAILLLVLIAVAYIYFDGIPKYKYDPPETVRTLQVPRDSALVERGAKIATLLCNECHRSDDGKLVGKQMLDMPAELAPSYSLNITQDKEHGIGNWTDGEIYYFLRTGIHKDGHWSPPFMPKFPLMADDDLYSIIAWLRSDDPALAPDTREFPPTKWNLLVKFLSHVAFTPPPLPEKAISIPDTTNLIKYGRYVADGLCACYACHSADFTKMDLLVPENSAGFYGGGNPMLNLEGETVNSANITMDKETGIGNWTYEQFYEAVKYSKSPKGGPLYYPMFPHTTLSDVEIKGIWSYLQTVPPLKNKVDRYKPKD